MLGYDFEGHERTIDSHVKNLRQDRRQPRNLKWLHTVHGVGLPLRGSYQERPVIARSFRVLAAGAVRFGVRRPLRRSSMTETEAKTAHSETAEEVAPPAASSPSPERKKEKSTCVGRTCTYTTCATLAFALHRRHDCLVPYRRGLLCGSSISAPTRPTTCRRSAIPRRTASRPFTRRPAICGIPRPPARPPRPPSSRAVWACG